MPLGRREEVLGRVELPVSLQREGEGVLEGLLLRLRHDVRVSMNCMGFTSLVLVVNIVNGFAKVPCNMYRVELNCHPQVNNMMNGS